MSGVSSAGYKAPAGIGSRQDGGGPGSGNWYAQFGEPHEEEHNEETINPMNLTGNPFSQLVFTSPVIQLKSALMKSFTTSLANAHYQRTAARPVLVAADEHYGY